MISKTGAGKIPETVKIPGGRFLMGSPRNHYEGPVREVTVEGFEIGKYSVTREEFRHYLWANQKPIPAELNDQSTARHPVTNVDWISVGRYCNWLKKMTGQAWRPLREAEWEFAARGTEGFNLPWGQFPELLLFDALLDKLYQRREHIIGTESVDARSDAASPFGVHYMIGNVWEMLADRYQPSYDPNDVVNPVGPEKGTHRVLRGGNLGIFLNIFETKAESKQNIYPFNYMVALTSRFTITGLPSQEIGFRVGKDIG
jgi:formylglycine-generating enzyme required for sulfatase activity